MNVEPKNVSSGNFHINLQSTRLSSEFSSSHFRMEVTTSYACCVTHPFWIQVCRKVQIRHVGYVSEGC
jgi:hypothetical protein